MSILDGFLSLGNRTNKLEDNEKEFVEGVVSDKVPTLELNKSDEELVKLATKWKTTWDTSEAKKQWLTKAEENERYWLGKQFGKAELDEKRPLIDNVIFEALETFLPQATRQNPEPTVKLKHGNIESEESTQYAEDVKHQLADIADIRKIRLKIKRAARYWSIYLLGVAKYSWDVDSDMPAVKILRPNKLILDPNATIDEEGYNGQYIGEYRKMTVDKLADIVEKNKEEILKLVDKNQKGTEIQFIEWWTRDFFFWTINDHVLLKKKNPHWNYDSTETQLSVNDFGTEVPEEVEKKGINHFRVKHMPYSFLSIFNLGKHPVDDTSLLTQNLSSQDLVNKRLKQVDRNVDGMNGGTVVSLERSGLNQTQANQVGEAFRKGATVSIPSGAPREAVERYNAPSLPTDVFNQLVDTRSRMLDVFGVKGSTPSGIQNEDTVRGKMITRNLDTDRIGGGITEYLEQFADDIYNWLAQLLYVYNEAFQEVHAEIPPPELVISVKEGSLLPKDSTTLANQAIELANAGKMSTVDLYKRLEFPNPEEMAANAWLELNAPHMLFPNDPRIAQVMQQQMQQAQMEQQAEQEAQAAEQEDKEFNRELQVEKLLDDREKAKAQQKQ